MTGPQYARVVRPADGDASGVEVLEQSLGELAAGLQLVAQRRERDGAVALDDQADAVGDLGERVGVRPQVATDPLSPPVRPQSRQMLRVLAQIGLARRLVPGGAEPLLDRKSGVRERLGPMLGDCPFMNFVLGDCPFMFGLVPALEPRQAGERVA